MKNNRLGVLTELFVPSFVFVFETDLLESNYLTNGWQTLRLIRYKIKFQHIKKVNNTVDRNYLCFKKFITYNLHIFLDRELSSPFTKTKEKPDG